MKRKAAITPLFELREKVYMNIEAQEKLQTEVNDWNAKLDIVGINGKADQYEKLIALFPQKNDMHECADYVFLKGFVAALQVMRGVPA